MSDSDVVKEFLGGQEFMVVSVVLADGSPWAVPVRILHHEPQVFEWDSATSAEHSQVIALRPEVMLLCYDTASQVGVYMQAKVTRVTERDDGYARYRAEVSRLWLNDHTFVKREVEL